MKKRFFAILLTVVMVLALAVPAAAYTVNETKLDQVWHYNTYIKPETNHMVKTQHGNYFGYVNYNDQIIVQEKYTKLNDFSEGLAVAEKDGATVYVDLTGKEVITLGKVAEAHDFKCGLARIVTTSGTTYFIDKTGKSVFTCGNATATDFKPVAGGQPLAKVLSTDGKYGLVNLAGNEITHFRYDEIRDFSCGLAYWRIGTRQGFLNVNGYSAFELAPTTALRVGYDVVDNGVHHSDYSDNMVIVENVTAPVDSRIGYLDITGYQAVHSQFEQGDDFAGNVARIKRDGKWGYINKANQYTVQPIYDLLDRGTGLVRAMQIRTDTVAGTPVISVVDGHLVVQNTTTQSAPYQHWGFVNAQNGVVAVNLIYTNARPFTADNLAYVELGGAKGFVNTTGAVVVNAGGYYDRMGDSYEGKAWVVKNGKWGYIATNEGGRLAIPMVFDVDGVVGYPNLTGYCNFRSGVAVACWGNVLANTDKGSDVGRYGVINASGTWLTANYYSKVDYMIYADRIALAQYGGQKIRFVKY